MAYREHAAPVETPRVVRYGPFPLRKREIAVGIAGIACLGLAWEVLELDAPGASASGVPLLVLGTGCLVVGLRALAQVRSLRLAVWPRAAKLRVTQLRLGIPTHLEERVLGDVIAVHVERAMVGQLVQLRDRHTVPAGRLALRRRDGQSDPITEAMHPGNDVHDRAARELAAVLGIEDVSSDPRPTPVLHPTRPGSSARGALRWIAGAIAVGSVLQAFVMLYANQTQGWLAVECRQRCRMGGLECLPGGSWSSSFDPGNVTIELWDESASEALDGWQRIVIPIEVGHTTHYVCERGAEPVIE